MIHAYNETYLRDVMRNLAAFFDIGINAVGLDSDKLGERFATSHIALAIERGNPNYLSGKSATELLIELLEEDVPYNQVPMDRTPEYWAGWVLAYTQWYLNKTFKEIIDVMPFSKLVRMYHPYHEAPESKTVEIIKSLFSKETPLKQIRILRELSQSQLARISGVKLRNIQCYEQGDTEIGNARGETLYALAKALDCSIESLLR